MANMKISDFLDDDGVFNENAEPPASLGACVDLYHAAREMRLAMEKIVDAGYGKLESALREHLIANLSSNDTTGTAGQRYRAQIVKKRVFRVTDWPAFHEFVKKTGRFDFLQKRLGETAVSDWVDENKKLLPGMESMNVPEISVTKIPGR